jgi:hypothetical protein
MDKNNSKAQAAASGAHHWWTPDVWPQSYFSSVAENLRTHTKVETIFRSGVSLERRKYRITEKRQSDGIDPSHSGIFTENNTMIKTLYL